MVVLALGLILTTVRVIADTGVGVTLAAVQLDQKLAPGGSFELPAIGVINTGSDENDYEIAVSYPSDQTLRRPPSDWFAFEPQHFHLDSGKNQSVAVRLTLPSGAQPGDYFAYLEAHTVSDPSRSVVGPAAATKLSFSVKPSSWLAAQRLRFNRFLDDNQPWTWLLPALALGCIAFWTARRYLPYRIRSPFERR